jgi:N utilization substance protein A
MQNIDAEFDASTGAVRLFDVKTVVEDIPPEELEKLQLRQAELAAERMAEEAAKSFGYRPREEERSSDGGVDGEEGEEDEIAFNPKTDIMISEAKVLKMDAEVGDVIRTELPLPGEFGRMAAMTAKQVITQKLREAEREIIFNEFKEQEGEVLIGTVQRREGRVILVDLGRSTGILIPEDQVRGERYNPGDRIKVYVREVTLGTRGPQILLSRASEELVRILFDLEIPEISEGLVVIKAIAREAGARSKVAVTSSDNSIDPIGACIGQRGIRIQTIINELGGEKIDVIEWSDDPKTYITNALAPAKVIGVELDEEENTAIAQVGEDQLSLAIGRGGQNVRLAAKLTDWKLSVREEGVEQGAGRKKETEEDAEGTEETTSDSSEGEELTEEGLVDPEVLEEAEETKAEVEEVLEDVVEDLAEEAKEEKAEEDEE